MSEEFVVSEIDDLFPESFIDETGNPVVLPQLPAVCDSIQAPVFGAKNPKAPKPPKPPKPVKEIKPKKETALKNPLLEAVEFIELAQKAKGDAVSTHCAIRYGTITAFDRTIAAGVIIQADELHCFPNTEKLVLALKRCTAEYRMIQMADQLFIESGEFQAYVPLAPADTLISVVPDAPIAPLGNTFRDALLTVGTLVKDNGATLLQSCIQLNPVTAIASNGQVIMEAFHGFDMPPNKLLIPKCFADKLKKTKKNIASFGFSSETFTVHFEDRSWLRTNLYKDKLAHDLVAMISVEPAHKRDVPTGFFGAANEVSKWSSDGRVYCFDSRISSHSRDKQAGSAVTFAMDGFADSRIYSALALKMIAKYALSMDVDSSPDITLFFGNIVRGAVMHDRIETEHVNVNPAQVAALETYTCQDCGHAAPGCVCDIPF